jgi:hypothetical protein
MDLKPRVQCIDPYLWYLLRESLVEEEGDKSIESGGYQDREYVTGG